MFEVQLTFIPHGRRTQAYEISTLVIINDTTGTNQAGNYDVRIDAPRGQSRVTLKSARVENWPRLERDEWSLAAAALKALGVSGEP